MGELADSTGWAQRREGFLVPPPAPSPSQVEELKEVG